MRSKYTTFGEYVYRLVKDGKKDSEEFKDLEKFHGINKLREIYVAERDRQNKLKNTQAPLDFRREAAGDTDGLLDILEGDEQ